MSQLLAHSKNQEVSPLVLCGVIRGDKAETMTMRGLLCWIWSTTSPESECKVNGIAWCESFSTCRATPINFVMLRLGFQGILGMRC